MARNRNLGPLSICVDHGDPIGLEALEVEIGREDSLDSPHEYVLSWRACGQGHPTSTLRPSAEDGTQQQQQHWAWDDEYNY